MPSPGTTPHRTRRRRGGASTILIGLWIFGALAIGALIQPDPAIADGLASVQMTPPSALSKVAPEAPPIVALIACAVVAFGAGLLIQSGRWRAVPHRVRNRVTRRR